MVKASRRNLQAKTKMRLHLHDSKTLVAMRMIGLGLQSEVVTRLIETAWGACLLAAKQAMQVLKWVFRIPAAPAGTPHHPTPFQVLVDVGVEYAALAKLLTVCKSWLGYCRALVRRSAQS